MKTILLVDDDEQLRGTFALMLRNKGYRVIEADSGGTGFEMAQRHLPDLILSDIYMPGGNGDTLLRLLRRDRALRSKQIVLMTGCNEESRARKSMEDGADDFLVKPVSLEALLGCVEARFHRASINWRVEDQALAALQASVPAQLPHEFFTPLAGIIGLMEILREESAVLSPEETGAIYNDVSQSALRLHRTLRNYLLILEDRPLLPETPLPTLSAGDVEKEIQLGIQQVSQIEDRRQDVTVQLSDCAILAEPGDISRIVEELVDNACKFSRHATPVKVDLSREGKLTVTDEGRGLTSYEISCIGAFQQFDKQKFEQQGLGLGLVLVQKLSARCKGEFSIQSQPGRGTCVQVSLKLA
jgi:CheY-like chemotaxis protein